MEFLIVAVLRGYEREKVVTEEFETTREKVEEDTLAAMGRVQCPGFQIDSFAIVKL